MRRAAAPRAGERKPPRAAPRKIRRGTRTTARRTAAAAVPVRESTERALRGEEVATSERAGAMDIHVGDESEEIETELEGLTDDDEEEIELPDDTPAPEEEESEW